MVAMRGFPVVEYANFVRTQAYHCVQVVRYHILHPSLRKMQDYLLPPEEKKAFQNEICQPGFQPHAHYTFCVEYCQLEVLLLGSILISQFFSSFEEKREVFGGYQSGSLLNKSNSFYMLQKIRRNSLPVYFCRNNDGRFLCIFTIPSFFYQLLE